MFRYHRERSGVAEGHPHTLRHTFRTALAEAGVDLSVIQALMGQDHVDSAAAYIHLASSFCARSSMPPALGYAPAPEADLLAAYAEHCDRLGLISVNLGPAARTFLRHWPDPQRWAGQPLKTRLAMSDLTRSFVMYLMLAGHLRPGYDYLIRRKLRVFWCHLPPGPLGGPGQIPRRRRTRFHRTHPQRHRIPGDRRTTHPERKATRYIDRQQLRRLVGCQRGATWPRKASRHYSSAAHTAPSDVPSRRIRRAAGERNQPATAKLCRAYAGCHPRPAGLVGGRPRPAHRQPYPQHRHRHREPTQPLRRALGRDRPSMQPGLDVGSAAIPDQRVCTAKLCRLCGFRITASGGRPGYAPCRIVSGG